jgi:hypothetical protein
MQVGQVFQPFHRGENGRSNAKGIGLGLAISKSLVEMMGGTLAVTTAKDKGSSFFFQITFGVASQQLSGIESRPLTLTPFVGRKSPMQMKPSSPDLTNEIVDLVPWSSQTEFSESMIASDEDLTVGVRAELPYRFLVVDDNAINKRLFQRTVDNMFKKMKRKQTPVYTFASNGTHVFRTVKAHTRIINRHAKLKP